MIGPTGVGKTEIARRLARLAQSPFLKIEASKFTEVGYVGRDVESMIRDLVEIAIKMVREEREAEVRDKARRAAEERLLDLLLPPSPVSRRWAESSTDADMAREHQATDARAAARAVAGGQARREDVEIETRDRAMPSFELIQGSSIEEIGVNLRDMMPGMFQGRTRTPADAGARSVRSPDAGRSAEADRHGCRVAAAHQARRRRRHHFPGRDRQDCRPRRRAGPGREPRGRAARHPADRRRHDGQHEVRHGAHRPHPVHRRRRVSRRRSRRI